MWQVFEPELKRRLQPAPDQASTAERVHAVLLELLPGNDASIDNTAQRLGMSKRTLQRRLEQEEKLSRPCSRLSQALAHATISIPRFPAMKSPFCSVLKIQNSFYRAFLWRGPARRQKTSET